MYKDPETGRTLYGFWNEETKQWDLDLQGLIIIKRLANAARKRMQNNPESLGYVSIPVSELTQEEIDAFDEELANSKSNNDVLLKEIDLAEREIAARAKDVIRILKNSGE